MFLHPLEIGVFPLKKVFIYIAASSTFRVGQQFFKTIARMYSSFIDDSVPFRRSLERNISQSCVGSIDSKKKRIEHFQSSMGDNVGWRYPFGDVGR